MMMIDVNDDGYDESSAVSTIQWTNSHNINTNSGTEFVGIHRCRDRRLPRYTSKAT